MLTGQLPIANCQMHTQGEIMQKRFAVVTLIILVLTGVSTTAFAQDDKSKRPSPPAQAQCKLPDGKTVTIDYSSPREKGRKIFGGLVPFGKVWRAGANEATTFVTGTGLTVGGKDVPAGNYTIFAIPSAENWTLVVSKGTGEWGTDYPGEAKDLTRVEMKTAKTSAPVENFTIAFDQMGKGCTLRMSWENTEASVMMSEK
jgi:hypothetical protein